MLLPETLLTCLISVGTSRPASLSSGSSQKVFSKRVVALIVALGIFTYHAMTFENLLPIFFQDDRVSAGGREVIAILANSNGSFAGGLGLSVKDVGVIMSLNGKLSKLGTGRQLTTVSKSFRSSSASKTRLTLL